MLMEMTDVDDDGSHRDGPSSSAVCCSRLRPKSDTFGSKYFDRSMFLTAKSRCTIYTVVDESQMDDEASHLLQVQVKHAESDALYESVSQSPRHLTRTKEC